MALPFGRAFIVAAAVATTGSYATERGSTGTQKNPMTPVTSAMEAVPFDVHGLALRLHAANQREIMLGKLTLEKATTQHAKEVARIIIKDHQAADAKLMKMAQKKGWTLRLPHPMTEEERVRFQMLDATVALLKVVNPKEYDSLYLSAMVANHDHALALIDQAARKFGGKTHEMLEGLAPKIEAHRKAAYDALGKLKPPTADGVGGSGKDDVSDADAKVEEEPNTKKEKIPKEDLKDFEDGLITNDALGGEDDPL